MIVSKGRTFNDPLFPTLTESAGDDTILVWDTSVGEVIKITTENYTKRTTSETFTIGTATPFIIKNNAGIFELRNSADSDWADLTIGNLTVQGTTTTINTETVTIDDNIIVLNNNEIGTPTQDAGIEIERGTSTNESLLWKESNDHWEVNTKFFSTMTGTVPGFTVNRTDGTWATFSPTILAFENGSTFSIHEANVADNEYDTTYTGTDKLVIDASGNVSINPTSGDVSIGGTNINAKLTVTQTANTRALDVYADNTSTDAEFEIARLARKDNTVGRGGKLSFSLDNSSAALVEYANIVATITTNTAGSHEGTIDFNVSSSGSLTKMVRVRPTGLEYVIDMSGSNGSNDLWIPDKKYVDDAVNIGLNQIPVGTGSGITSFSSLTYIDGAADLNTYLGDVSSPYGGYGLYFEETTNGSLFGMGMNDTYSSFEYYFDGTGSSYVNGYVNRTNTDWLYGVSGTYTGLAANNVKFELSSSASNSYAELNVANYGKLEIGQITGLRITDYRGTPTGFQYIADYSSTFVNESLVTKRYVDDAVGSTPSTLQDILDNGNSATITGDIPITINREETSTNTQLELAKFGRRTTGTGANGIGGYITIEVENSAADVMEQLQIKHVLTDANSTTSDSALYVSANVNNVVQNILEVSSTGTLLGHGAIVSGTNGVALGVNSLASFTGAMAYGNNSRATATGAIIMGYHTSNQSNSVTDSFMLAWDGDTILHMKADDGLEITPREITLAAVNQTGVSITQTLNDAADLVASSSYTGLEVNITETSTVGWADVNLFRFWNNGNSGFKGYTIGAGNAVLDTTGGADMRLRRSGSDRIVLTSANTDIVGGDIIFVSGSGNGGTIIIPSNSTSTSTGGLRYNNGRLEIYDGGWNSVSIIEVQENVDVDSAAAEVVVSVATAGIDGGVFVDYVVQDGTNYRAGIIMMVTNGTIVNLSETSTADIGDTTGVTFSAAINTGNLELSATVTTDNWDIKTYVRSL